MSRRFLANLVNFPDFHHLSLDKSRYGKSAKRNEVSKLQTMVSLRAGISTASILLTLLNGNLNARKDGHTMAVRNQLHALTKIIYMSSVAFRTVTRGVRSLLGKF